MRRALALAVAAGLMASVVSVTPAAGAPNPARLGAFGPAFREDHFSRGDRGCVDDGNGGFDCLPAAASVTVLPDGRILYWNALEGMENVDTHAVVQFADKAVVDTNRLLSLDPTNAANSAWATPGESGVRNKHPKPMPGPKTQDPDRHMASLFCADHKLLADGRLIAVGGTDYYQDPRVAPGLGGLELEGTRTTRIFDPTDDSWREAGEMKFGRWYPSMVTLPDGDLFVASGVTKLIKPVYPNAPEYSGTNVKPSETYDLATDKWTKNRGGDRSLPLFPRLHLLPNGKVFYDTAGQVFNPMGESYDEALWNLAAVYDPNAKATNNTSRWYDLGIPGIGTTTPGFRGSTFSVPLRLDPPYTTARFLTAGGVVGTTPGTLAATKESRISEVIMRPGELERYNTFPTKPLNNARWFSSAVPLPDGTIMAFNGSDIDGVIAGGYESPVRQAELFTPTRNGHNGTWKRMASGKHDRTYHSSAVLLPDGRVLVGGHAPIPNGDRKAENAPDVPGVRNSPNNFHDASFEIFTPPYATRTDRPTINSYEPVLAHDTTTAVGVSDPGSVDSVVLMRNPSTTHIVDGDARSVGLKIIGRDATSVHVAVPAQAAVLPPGPYYLFVNTVGADGVTLPSVAKQVFIGTNETPAFVADPAGNVGYTAKPAQTTPSPVAAALDDVAAPPVARPSLPLPTRLIHNSGIDDFAAVVVGLGVAVLWLSNRGRRRRTPGSSSV